METRRILLADDHTLLRAGIRALIEKIPHVRLVDEVDNGRDAVERTLFLKPDVVFMDISMRELNGLEALSRIKQAEPGIRVVILTMYSNEEYVIKAMQSGASGYVLKNCKPSELELAIETVMVGEVYISPNVARTLTEYLQKSGQIDDPLAQLTSRQREILQLIAEGKSTKEMADLLKISTKTVEMHRAQLMARLHIRDIPGLVRYAIRMGLVDSDC